MTIRDIALYTHLLSLTLTACVIAYSDLMGFRWMFGMVPVLEKKMLYHMHNAVGVGLGLMLGSGSVLFWNAREYLLTDKAFYIKMAFVLALILNSFIIDKHVALATMQEFKNVLAREKRSLILSGAVSTLSWIGAAISATFLF